MIIVLKQHAPADKVQAFCNELNSMGFQINDSVGSDTHILGLIGDTKALAESWVLANPVVETCRRVSEPYKKANRKFHPDDTIVDVGGHKIGGGYFAVMSGPCSVESKEQITYVAQRVQAAGASILRGGAFKPRTSPYSFQGLRAEGLELLQEARKVTGQPIVTELMNNEHIPLFVDAKVDMIQIGARNMQNFELLKAVGKLNVPVLLKRGLSSTLEELVMSAEYIMAEGNPNVVLCERGIRKGAFRYFSLKLLRYSSGAYPVLSLNIFVKYEKLLYPTYSDTVLIGSVLCVRSFFASSTRFWMI